LLGRPPIVDSEARQSSSAICEVAGRPRWRDAVAAGLFYSGALRIVQAIARNYELKRDARSKFSLTRRKAHPKFVVLCYHRIGIGGIPLFSELSPPLFEAQIRYVSNRYRVLSLDDLCAEMERPSGKDDGVTVTFDDGYRDLYTHALPVLRKYRIPATIYLPLTSIETGEVPWYDRIFLALKVWSKDELEIVLDRPRTFLLGSLQSRIRAAAEIIQHLRTLPDDTRKEYCQLLEERTVLPQNELEDRMLTWEQIRAMRHEGISFGSHTMTHPVVSRLTAAQLERELADSKSILELRIGSPAAHFAYPFGKPADCGTLAEPFLKRVGYRSAVTTVEGSNQPGDNRYEFRRTQICNESTISMFALKLNQLFLSYETEASGITGIARTSVRGEPFADPEVQPRADNA
jgi:peptidoglycan/xylan/chitin deacetylase (PgdA/CDA1 family)